MVVEVLAAYHSGWDPQLTGLARLRPSTTDQANNSGMTYKTGMTRQVSTLNVLARQQNTQHPNNQKTKQEPSACNTLSHINYKTWHDKNQLSMNKIITSTNMAMTWHIRT